MDRTDETSDLCPRCQAMGRGSDCAGAVLLDLRCADLPAWVCPHVVLASTRLFATLSLAATTGQSPAGRLAFQSWTGAWPLPVGERSIRRFAALQGFDRMDLPCSLADDDPDAEIGLWIERHVPEGRVRLLGPVTRDEAGRVGRFGEAYIEVTPAPRVYRGRVPAVGRDPMLEVAREMARWYRRLILGRPAEGIGRPAGPHAGFEEREGRAYREALEALRRSGRRATVTAIATEMSLMLGYEVGRTTLQYWLRQGWLPVVRSEV